MFKNLVTYICVALYSILFKIYFKNYRYKGRFNAKLQFVFNFQSAEKSCKKLLNLFLLHRENILFNHRTHTIHFCSVENVKRNVLQVISIIEKY